METLRTTCLALSIDALRHVQTPDEYAQHYAAIRSNSRSFTPVDIVAILRAVVPRLHVHHRDHLIAVRRAVEYYGNETLAGRVSDPFDPAIHVIHVPDASHLDGMPSGSDTLLGATLRHGRRGGVLLWW